jgi:hypothetical protein
LARASVPGHNPKRVVPHPTWHLLAPRAVDVAVSGRYVYYGHTHQATVIDEQTGKRALLIPRADCFLGDETVSSFPLGGSWVVAACSPPPLGPGYELYSIPNRKWIPFSADMRQMCARDTGWQSDWGLT